MMKTVAENVLIYMVAAAMVWYVGRHIPLRLLLHSIEAANLWWFVPATLLSLCIWFFGENLLYSRMFSYFHEQTGYVELIPATAAAYFMQVVNIMLAAGTFVLFLHRRKHTAWIAGGVTILFLGFIDGFLLSSLALLSALFIPGSPLGRFLPYAAGMLGALVLVPVWWIWRRPANRLERWLRERPSLVSFRRANGKIYLELGLIRLGIFVPQGFIFYVCLAAFRIHVPLLIVLAVTPVILAAGGLPFTPIGLGPLQLVAVHEFVHFASSGRILAMFLLFSVCLLLYRLPLGISSAGAYVKAVLAARGREPGSSAPASPTR